MNNTIISPDNLDSQVRNNDIFVSNTSQIYPNIIQQGPLTIALPYYSNRIVFVDTDISLNTQGASPFVGEARRLIEKYRYILNIFFECWFISGSIVIAFFIVYFIIKNN